MIDYTPSEDAIYQNEIAHLRAELQRKSDAIQRLWRERDELRAAAEEARRVLSMPLLMEGDAPVENALKMLDEALGDKT